MDKKTADTVEVVTQNLIETALADREAECDIVVTSQRLIEMDEADSTRRSLRVQRALTSGLEVDLDFSCTATRSGDNADIEELILSELSTNTDEFKQLLADNATFFSQYNQRVEQKLPSHSAIVSQEESKSGKGKTIGIILGVLGSLLVFAVSMFTMRERRSDNGTAPLRVIHEDSNEFYDLRPNTRKALDVINEDENDTYDLNAISIAKNENVVTSKPQKSEQRKEIVSQKLGMMSEAIKSKTKSKSKSEEEDEKTSTSFLPEKLKDAVKRGIRDVWIYANDDGKDLGEHPVVSDLSNPSEADGVISPTSQGGYLDSVYYQNAADKMVGDQFDTRAIMTPFAPKSSRNGLLGAGSRQGPPVTAYSFSSPTSTTRSYRSFKKDKVFEVYAPPGPLGVIIDTSKEGPLIHSLRKDSQLKDLVNPGDLIVALDDEDTRHMTAAKLTRKMASKSGETRKITLLKGLAPPTPIASVRNATSFQSPLSVRNAMSFQSTTR